MRSGAHKIHICDDWISCKISDLHQIHALSDQLHATAIWMEVVGGLDSLAVQYDPSIISPDQAAVEFQKQLSNSSPGETAASETIELPVCYSPAHAPDLDLVAKRLGITSDQVANWHSQLQFTVAQIGFMPGFAYLQCDSEIPNIGRLPQPRQKITAGSVGIIGDQSCVYSFDSPGGWPIIGRCPVPLFDPSLPNPALLNAGQQICFVPINQDEYLKIIDLRTE